MNAISSLSSPNMMHEFSHTSIEDTSGSVMAFMIELQHLLTKEAREDKKLQQQEQMLQTRGFSDSVANFFSGPDSGTGNVRSGLAATQAPGQSNAALDNWKFLKLR